MKAILIARVSTQEQQEAGNSLPAQVARLEQYCHNKKLSIVKIFSFDESAYKNQRAEFDTIFDFIVQHSEKLVICCDKVDRLSRNIFDKRVSMLYQKALNDELELHFVSENQILNSRISAVEKFQFSISLGLAKYYSDAISDNVKRAQEQKLRNGEWLSKAPYGYKNRTTPTGQADIVIDEFTAHILQQLFSLYATGAFSMELLCQKVNKDYNVLWLKGSLGKALCNPFYYGEMKVKDRLYPHRYPTLITKKLFDEVQAVKANFNKKPIKYAGIAYLYRGLLRCATCDLSITPEKHKGFVYYHCTQYKGKHGAKWIREEAITEQLALVFKNLQMPVAMTEQLTQSLEKLHQDKVEFHTHHFDKLVSQQKKLTKMMDNLYLDKLQGSITDSAYDKFYQSLRSELSDTNHSLEQLQQAENNYYITAKYLVQLASRAYDLFVSSEVTQKRQLLKLVLSNLRLEGKKVRFEAKKPFNLLLDSADDTTWRS